MGARASAAEDGRKTRAAVPPLPPFAPQLLSEPRCTSGGIPDTTLKQQGTKPQQPDS